MSKAQIQQSIRTAFVAMLAACAGAATAAPGTISQSPLFLSDSVEPNIIMGLDDSGSMDFETLLPTNDGALWWSDTSRSFVNNDGTLRFQGGTRYIYLFPNGYDGGDRRGATRSYDGGFQAIPPTLEFAFIRSADFNLNYYDYTIDYKPWKDTGIRTFTDSPPTAAPWDPIARATTFTADLTSNFAPGGTNGERFDVRTGMRDNAGNIATGNNDQGFTYFPATYYVVATSGGGIIPPIAPLTTVTNFDCSAPDPATYRAFRQNPTLAVTIGDIDAIGPGGECLTRYEIRNDGTVFPSGRSYADEIQNFANWFTYYRKRHQAMRAGVNEAFSELTGVRAGLFTFNNQNNVTMFSLTTDRDAFLDDVFNARGIGGTPIRRVVDHMGRQFERTGSGAPILEACQKNFGIVFSDGFSNTNNINVGNVDGTQGPPFADAFADTIADAAMEYYENLTIAGFASGQVPTPAACAGTPPPGTDCNDDLHMVTYAVTLNTLGDIFGVTHFNKADAFANPPAWVNPVASFNPYQVDDLYHATVNGRGELLNATRPTEIAAQLGDVLNAVLDTEGTAAAVTFNTGLLSSDSLVYQAKLDSKQWSGFLTATPLDPITGAVASAPAWDAADSIPAEAARQISTYDPASGGVPFRSLAALPPAAQADLNTDLPAGFTAQDILDYLRGDRSNESPSGLRERAARTVLGDIVHSGPVLVGKPGSDWPDTAPFPTGLNAYSTYEQGPAGSRREAVYVGSNDGMLHGFWADESAADSGEEFMAFVPHSLYSSTSGEGLHELAQIDYQHRYYVDLTPVVTDAFVATTPSGTPDWHSVLIGGLRNGGAGYFALDVTDPTAMRESNASDYVMWEFTSNDDADLGATFAEPTVALMANGRWAVIFGNGYNNPGSGQAALFILFIEGGLDRTWTLGTDYIKIVVPGANNGLSSPQLADLDSDGVPDRIYAGDLLGNMWAFDVSSPNDNLWESDYRTGPTPKPLFTAVDGLGTAQPITSRPVLARCPYNNSVSPDVMVLFGTGQYITEGDKSTTDQQTFYAIWDRGTDELSPTDLLEQFANDPTLSYDTTAVRVPSDFAFDPANDFGWRMDLPDAGERTVANPLVRGNIVFFNTIIPSATDPCVIGGGGWLMSINICDGGRPDQPVFDLNRDGVINNGDVVADASLTDSNGDPITNPPGGERFDQNEGLPWQSSILSDKQYTPGSSGSIENRNISISNNALGGRLSWEQIIND